MMRSHLPLFFLLLSIPLLFIAVTPSSSATTPFTEETVFYTVAGEMCWDAQFGIFTPSYPVQGEMRITLEAVAATTVNYDFEYSITNELTGFTIEYESRSGTLTDRMEVDGNYTLFFISIPPLDTVFTDKLDGLVEVHYVGARYVDVNGHSIKTHYYGYTISDSNGIIRFEWFFEWESGILLRFCKTMEMNFIRIQWLDFSVKNTTLSLSGVSPVTAFFGNFRETLYAGLSAGITVLILYTYLRQVKGKREGKP